MPKGIMVSSMCSTMHNTFHNSSSGDIAQALLGVFTNINFNGISGDRYLSQVLS